MIPGIHCLRTATALRTTTFYCLFQGTEACSPPCTSSKEKRTSRERGQVSHICAVRTYGKESSINFSTMTEVAFSSSFGVEKIDCSRLHHHHRSIDDEILILGDLFGLGTDPPTACVGNTGGTLRLLSLFLL